MEQHTSSTFQSICSKNGIKVTSEQLGKLEEFISLLLQANRSLNLISRKDEGNIWFNHIMHSISPTFLLSFDRLENVLDLGTGGGLPGIPLKIVLPNIQITLVDSVHKKVSAVRDILNKLDLKRIRVICSRVEDLSKTGDYSGRFDAVISRAVAPLKKLIEWSAPLLKTSTEKFIPPRSGKTSIPLGSLLVFKGGDIDTELVEAKLHKRVRSIFDFPLVFHGSDVVSLTEKKIVIIQFRP